MNVEEQINNLKQIGLQINNETFAYKILNEVSYYRLIKAYSLFLKNSDGTYKENVTFEDIVDLYFFNVKLRQLLFTEIEKIEISLRCRVANYFSDKYGVLGYLERTNFANEEYHARFLEEMFEEIKRNSKSPFVRNFTENYENGTLPLYALVEILSFGALSKFYKNLRNDDKKMIASQYGLSYAYLESWIESIAYVRNICAHYGRLYNATLSKTPRLYKEYTKAGIRNNQIFAVLLCMKHIFGASDQWKECVVQIEKLINIYKIDEKNTLGFPPNWFDLLVGL